MATVALIVASCSKPPTMVSAPAIIDSRLKAVSAVPSPDAQVCAGCHPKEVEAWKGSQHANANRLLEARLDQVAFSPERTLVHGSFKTTTRMRDGNFEFVTVGPGSTTRVYRAEAAIGITPLVQYLVPFPGGRLQTVDVSYDPRSNEWFNAFGAEDRQPHEWGYWTNRSMNWNTQCAFCHMTGFEKNYDPVSDSYASTWDAMGISCAQCHVVSNQLSVTSNQCPLVAPASNHQPSTINPFPYLDNCASCHARREQMTDTYKPGDDFHDHFRLTLADNPATFYPDGQIRDEDYEYNSFMTSRMGHKGVTCLDCHDPHSYKLKAPAENNALCLSCHIAPGQRGASVIDFVTHSHHSLTNKGSTCVECHMPHGTYMVRDNRRDHGFTSPDPQLTKELGIPNACTKCHLDKPVEWSIDWVNQWYGAEKMEQRRSRQRARVIARAQAGDDSNVSNLLAMARSEEIISWQATLLTLLRPWAAQPEVTSFLRESLTNGHPLIRSAAVNALHRTPGSYDVLTPLRRDPSRLVRMDAAWATLNPIENDPASMAELVQYLNTVSDQPAGAIRQGQKALAEDKPALAESWMRKAAAWDPSAVPFSLLGQVLHENGKTAEAETLFVKAAAYDPANAEYLHMLALFYGETERLPDAVVQLEKAVTIDPGFGRAWYNLGLVHAEMQNLPEALKALQRAESLMLQSPEPAYAAATIHARMGDSTAARAAAHRALQIAPGYQPAIELLSQLPP